MALAEATARRRDDARVPLKTINPPKPTSSDLEIILDTLDAALPWDSVFSRLPDVDKEQNIKQGLTIAKSVVQNTQRLQGSLKAARINRAKHVYELHSKFSFGVICIIFLFIGAPMGAIVRKGGFGYPLLVSVIFFTIFILLMLMFKKLSETEAVDPVTGAWMPCIAMLPISGILTFKALNDVRMLNPEKWLAVFIRIGDWLQQQKKLRS
jgi:lipopolysaccharide export system permease protein